MTRKGTQSSAPSKSKIYFARTYRHLQFHIVKTILFLALFVVPSIVLMLFYYDELTGALNYCAAWLIHAAGGPEATLNTSEFIPALGPVYSLDIPTVLPGYVSILVNIAISLIVLWIMSLEKFKGHPFSVYMTIGFFVHIISCVFFLFGRDLFPYTVADYSDLYIKQEVGIWIMFLLLMGIIMGVLGNSNVFRRILTVVSVMVYSFCFGLVRYALFLMILSKASVLYMPIMFFALGPVFDFLYFVAFYAASTNHMIKNYDSAQKGEWVWA